MINTRSMFEDTAIKSLSAWTGGKRFGQYRGHRVLSNGIKILCHTGGFALFFPPEIFHKYDISVRIELPLNPECDCWIAGKGYGFVKIDFTPDKIIDKKFKNFFTDDIQKTLDKIEKYVKKNYVNAEGLYPSAENIETRTYASQINTLYSYKTSSFKF